MQKRIFASIILTLSITACSTTGIRSSQSRQEGSFESIPLIGNFVARRTFLNNGLKLIVLKDTSSPTIAYQTWFNVGSRNEVAGKTGLAHLFEHLMFKGTKNHPEGEFDSLLEQAGAEGENAFTTNDHTVYVQELPKNSLDLIINLESDRMVNLMVNDASFKMEREVVQNERRLRKENSPEGTIYQTMFETAYTNSSYHWPVIGYEQDLNLMSSQDARNFYEKYYNPSRATVIVVGDVDEDEVFHKVKSAYGKIKSPPSPLAPDEVVSENEQTAQRRKRLSLNIEVEKLWMGYKIGTAISDDAPALEIIQAILSEGKNCRLNRALVDSGIAVSVGTGSFNLKDPGLFLIEADLQKEKSAAVAEAVITRELERMKTNLVSIDEMKRAQNAVRFHLLEKLSTQKGKANFIGDTEIQLGGVEKGMELEKKVKEVTPEMIQSVAQKYFNTQKLTVISSGPKK